jgi:hypothetical protein
VPLEKYFPEYTGGDDINKAAKYILWRFMQANRARLSVYPQSVFLLLTFRNLLILFVFIKSNASNGHGEHTTCLCCSEGDNTAKCAQGLWYPVIRYVVLVWFSFSAIIFIASCDRTSFYRLTSLEYLLCPSIAYTTVQNTSILFQLTTLPPIASTPYRPCYDPSFGQSRYMPFPHYNDLLLVCGSYA